MAKIVVLKGHLDEATRGRFINSLETLSPAPWAYQVTLSIQALQIKSVIPRQHKLLLVLRTHARVKSAMWL